MTAHSPLQQARALALPSRDATLRRDPSVSRFWAQNAGVLREAWREWEEAERDHLPTLDDTLLDLGLREAVDAAWADPTAEQAVADLWEEVAPGVFQSPFFDPDRLADLRAYLDAAARARIPLRPPYGIVLNRRGLMLDPRSLGYLGAPAFQAFYRRILDRYFRPVSRLLFPEVMGYDGQGFGFSIEYQPSTDTSIRPHTDASSATLNININRPDEAFAGSVVDFYDADTGRPRSFTFRPGVAAIHRGGVAHAAHPITAGERTNLVLWLYGDGGQVPRRGMVVPAVGARQRWAVPAVAQDGFAPF
jgi:hypothetical protein